jgi:hypothetical protein
MKAKEGSCEGAKPYGELPGEVSAIERMKALRAHGIGSFRIHLVDPEKGLTGVLVLASGKPTTEVPPTPEDLWRTHHEGSTPAVTQRDQAAPAHSEGMHPRGTPFPRQKFGTNVQVENVLIFFQPGDDPVCFSDFVACGVA